jgi:ribosomal protein S11
VLNPRRAQEEKKSGVIHKHSAFGSTALVVVEVTGEEVVQRDAAAEQFRTHRLGL